jgi:hypothetical protein
MSKKNHAAWWQDVDGRDKPGHDDEDVVSADSIIEISAIALE